MLPNVSNDFSVQRPRRPTPAEPSVRADSAFVQILDPEIVKLYGKCARLLAVYAQAGKVEVEFADHRRLTVPCSVVDVPLTTSLQATRESGHFMDGRLKVRDLLAKDGSLYLFRYISEAYVPGRRGISSRHSGVVSHTINPLIYLRGQSFGYERTNPHILIVRQRLDDPLSFVGRAKDSSQHGSHPLTADTSISQFGSQFEVEVLPAKQNVVAVMSVAEFLARMTGVGDIETPADFRRVVEAVLSP